MEAEIASFVAQLLGISKSTRDIFLVCIDFSDPVGKYAVTAYDLWKISRSIRDDLDHVPRRLKTLEIFIFYGTGRALSVWLTECSGLVRLQTA